jgi:hypothetical protein
VRPLAGVVLLFDEVIPGPGVNVVIQKNSFA